MLNCISHCLSFSFFIILQVNVTESADSNSTEENTVKVEVNSNSEDAPASEESTPSKAETDATTEGKEGAKPADVSEEL